MQVSRDTGRPGGGWFTGQQDTGRQGQPGNRNKIRQKTENTPAGGTQPARKDSKLGRASSLLIRIQIGSNRSSDYKQAGKSTDKQNTSKQAKKHICM
jgi:hypothetical protein